MTRTGAIPTERVEDAHPEDWDLRGLDEAISRQFDCRLPAEAKELAGQADLVELVRATAERHYRAREAELGPEMFHRLERWIILGLEWEGGGFRGINQLWREHLLNMDHLKEGIGLRGYGQRDPLQEYKKESYNLFQSMKDRVEDLSIRNLFRIEPISEQQMEEERRRKERAAVQPKNFNFSAPPKTSAPAPAAARVDASKVGRNDPCPCGSGKKYKKCHGAASGAA